MSDRPGNYDTVGSKSRIVERALMLRSLIVLDIDSDGRLYAFTGTKSLPGPVHKVDFSWSDAY